MPTDNTIQWDIMLRTGLLPVFAISYTNLTRETENTAIYWKAQPRISSTILFIKCCARTLSRIEPKITQQNVQEKKEKKLTAMGKYNINKLACRLK